MFLAVSMNFTSGYVRVWSGAGSISISGNTYTGVGNLGRVSHVTERSNLTVERKIYQLAGVDPALLSETDIDASFGRSVIEYFGFINPENLQLHATPEINFEGEISNIKRVDGRDPFIEINAENRLVILDAPDGWRYTHEHQQDFFPGDLGLDQVPKLDTKEILWGGRRVVAGYGSGTQPPLGTETSTEV
jgi:hypothetical protein